MADPNIDFGPIIRQHYGELPHPQSKGHPPIKVKDWETALQLATATKFGGHAEPHEVDLFWQQFQGLNMQPRDYLEALEQLAQWSFRYHNKPPSMKEIGELQPLKPAEQHKYYQDLPDSQYPDVSAGQMMKAHAIADQYSKKHLGMGANKIDARFVHHSNMGPEQVDSHYRTLAEDAASKKGPDVAEEPF